MGKLVVGLKHQESYLHKLHEHCQKMEWPEGLQGVDPSEPAIDTELITGDRARELEPDLSKDITLALWSHSSGIVDTHALMESMESNIQASEGGEIVYSSDVVRVDPYRPPAVAQDVASSELRTDGWVVQLRTNGANSEGGDALLAKTLINASGLSSTLILNSLIPTPIPIFYAKGSYASYHGPGAKVSRLIYPVPETGKSQHSFQSLGTHLTIDLNGQVKFGPDLEYISPPPFTEGEDENVDYWIKHLNPDASRIPLMHEAITTYLPGVTLEGLAPDYAGIRPKLAGPGSPFYDFVIRTDHSRSLAGADDQSGALMVSLLGIESPGLTSCLALAELVVEKVATEQRHLKSS